MKSYQEDGLATPVDGGEWNVLILNICRVWHATVIAEENRTRSLAMTKDEKVSLAENTSATVENTFRAELTPEQAQRVFDLGKDQF